MIDALRILAYTPGDKELIELADKHIKETKQKAETMRIHGSGYVVADSFSFSLNRRDFIKERNFELYRTLSIRLKEKGYTYGSRGVSEKDFEQLEDEDNSE